MSGYDTKIYPATNLTNYVKTTGGILPKNPFSIVWIEQLDNDDIMRNDRSLFFTKLDSNNTFEGAAETYTARYIYDGKRYA